MSKETVKNEKEDDLIDFDDLNKNHQ